MKDCRKRQVEQRQGETIHRCINKKADEYRNPVDASACDVCPMRVYIEDRKKKPDPSKSMSLPVVDTSNYPPCEFRYRQSSQPTCGMTGLKVDKDVCQRCAKDTKMETATLIGKVMNYQAAVRKWVGAGRPVRSQEEIDRIYEEHCSQCNMYDKARKICNSCGCPATKDQPALRNKLKMATEACPLGRFPATVGEKDA